MSIPSYQIFMCFSVSGWCHSGYRFEYPVKMGQIRKPGLTADFCNILVGFHKFSLCIHNSGDIYILDYCAVGVAFKFTAQIIRADIEMAGKMF